MSAFLWTFVVCVGINLVAVLIDRFQTEISVTARAIGVAVDVVMAAWALYLLGSAS